ncbi:MAG: SDR family NAD(P)-dependent oxidoreductase [Bacteroidota bacterium]
MSKTILITGSTDGIGKLAALQLAKDGHTIYLHGRNGEKLKQTIAEIKTTSNNENINGFIADFSEMAAVRAMAATVKNTVPQLDVLINNAGVYKSSTATTEEGLDVRFAVNYFAPLVLTQELLPLLRARKDARIINLSSAAQAPVSLNALVGNDQLATHAAYAQSKLALTMWSKHLAESEPNLTVIAVNPGSLLNTRMVREGFGMHRSPADKGGAILYELATQEKYSSASGKYFDNDIGTWGTIHPAGQNTSAVQQLLTQTTNWLRKS